MSVKTYEVREGYPKPNCAAEWKRHRRSKWMIWILAAGWIPYGVAVVFILAVLNIPSDKALATAMSAYVLASGIFTARVSFFRCPRCGDNFRGWSQWGAGYRDISEKCRNCGLRKWQCD